MLEETGFKPGEFLYQKHNIDSLSLAESTKFYAKDPANLERIYLKVQQNLDSLKTDLEVIREEEKRIQDSINSLVPEGDSLRTRRDSLVKGNNLVPVSKAIDTLKPLPEMRRNRNPT
ncbi:DUF4296 domain-containing protein [Antarcticibacterium sp. 1MA-6-2]|uniref:DUF4296 domain-containing protein n=1 Tax=Antarcticibacterium sp. 1MA-6-2 TaxID=2908210 RepID=UPI001F3BE271|nr:DUF4296 domain-containing protein [Antarcticibacterium sp. 1MA-6-2]UJH90526.1 DUF4296 domain-containing protein [Antarcticibacterium sp. 1MA-6-2]